MAPSDTVWVHANGRMTIGETQFRNTGVWNTFSPGK